MKECNAWCAVNVLRKHRFFYLKVVKHSSNKVARNSTYIERVFRISLIVWSADIEYLSKLNTMFVNLSNKDSTWTDEMFANMSYFCC